MHIKELILKELPKATFECDDDMMGKGFFLDVRHEQNHVVIEYRPSHGFGVSASTEMGYGMGPDEIYKTEDAAATRTIYLLKTGEQTSHNK